MAFAFANIVCVFDGCDIAQRFVYAQVARYPEPGPAGY
jgi:hypothetical protein